MALLNVGPEAGIKLKALALHRHRVKDANPVTLPDSALVVKLSVHELRSWALR